MPQPPIRFRACIRAYDLERSVEFYRDQLGLPVLTEWDREDGAGALLDAGGGAILELCGKPRTMKIRGGWDFIPPTAKFDLIFEVPDVDARHRALVAAGAEPKSEPQTAGWGGRMFTILDPDETPVVFLQLPPAVGGA